MRSPTLLVLFGALAVACDRPTTPGPPAASSEAPKPSSAPASAPAASAPANPAATPSAAPTAEAGHSSETLVTFDADKTGEPSPAFEGVVGDWYVANEFGAQGLKVDGSKWRNGTPSANLADQAKRLYGDRYAEFLDGVKAFAYFPFAVWKGEPPSGDFKISVRFYPIAGQIDQGAGIAFGITPDGSYWGVRVNALENNLLFFRVVKGKRTIIDDVRDVPTPTRAWQTLSMTIRGKTLTADLDGKRRFEKTLDSEPHGRVGLWSKADSQMLFDDYKIEPLAATPSKPKYNPASEP